MPHSVAGQSTKRTFPCFGSPRPGAHAPSIVQATPSPAIARSIGVGVYSGRCDRRSLFASLREKRISDPQLPGKPERSATNHVGRYAAPKSDRARSVPISSLKGFVRNFAGTKARASSLFAGAPAVGIVKQIASPCKRAPSPSGAWREYRSTGKLPSTTLAQLRKSAALPQRKVLSMLSRRTSFQKKKSNPLSGLRLKRLQRAKLATTL